MDQKGAASAWRGGQRPARFADILSAALAGGAQSADKAHKRKNRSDKIEIRDDFCFLRQLHLHPAVTYVHVSSLGCKYSFLGLRAFSTLCQSVDFVNILKRPHRERRGAGVCSGLYGEAFLFEHSHPTFEAV